MSDTEVDYLQPDFVPSSVTMPRLRSILVSQNVPYPATAKKAQLVEIFNDNVAPRARKLLAQRQKAKRSSMGITNIDGSQGYSVPNDDLRAPPSARRSRSPRKPTRSFKQESEEPEHIPEHVTLSPRKRQARSAGRQLAPSDTDTDSYYESTRSPRKPSRGAELTPKPERRRAESEEDGDVYQRRSNEPDTVFTSDNPFQSRTPSMPMTTPLNRRRTAGLESTIKRNASSSLRRRAERPQDDDYDSTVYSERFETPASMFTRPVTPRTPRSPQPLTVEAGEEFTPDEQLAMNQEDAERAQQAMVPVRQNKRSTGLTTPLWVFFMTLFGAYAAWYRQEKLAVGYCGVGRPEHDLIPRQLEYKDYKFDVPEWAFQLVEPQCEPCPPHAYCYVDGSVRCEDAFILKPHPLSAGGLVPLPPTCEPDGEKVRRVKAVADKAIEELRERQAKFECGELVDEDGHQSQTPMIAVDELKETVSDKRSKKLNKKEFDDLWAAALGEIETRDEIMIEHKDDSESDSPGFGSVSNTYLASSSLARLPLRCAVRRSVRLSLERNRLSIISVVLFFISALYGRSRYRSYRAMSAQVPALVDLVLGRLAAQKELAYEEGGEDDPFLFLPNLRDDVLRRVFSLSERERIWQRVKAVVEQNTNVRTGQREGNNGEVGRAWEWIGPSGTLENGTRRRKTGRGVSWGADVKELEEDNKSAIHKQWEEPGSRPMY